MPVFGDIVVWDCAQGIGILSRFVYPCEFDPWIDIVLRSRSVILAISNLYDIRGLNFIHGMLIWRIEFYSWDSFEL